MRGPARALGVQQAMAEPDLLTSPLSWGVLLGIVFAEVLREVRSGRAFYRERRYLLWERQVERFDLLIEKTAQLYQASELLGHQFERFGSLESQARHLSRRLRRLAGVSDRLKDAVFLEASATYGKSARNGRLLLGMAARMQLMTQEFDALHDTMSKAAQDSQQQAAKLIALAGDLDVRRRISLHSFPDIEERFRKTLADVSVAAITSSSSTPRDLNKARMALSDLFGELLVVRDKLPALLPWPGETKGLRGWLNQRLNR